MEKKKTKRTRIRELLKKNLNMFLRILSESNDWKRKEEKAREKLNILINFLAIKSKKGRNSYFRGLCKQIYDFLAEKKDDIVLVLFREGQYPPHKSKPFYYEDFYWIFTKNKEYKKAVNMHILVFRPGLFKKEQKNFAVLLPDKHFISFCIPKDKELLHIHTDYAFFWLVTPSIHTNKKREILAFNKRGDISIVSNLPLNHLISIITKVFTTGHNHIIIRRKYGLKELRQDILFDIVAYKLKGEEKKYPYLAIPVYSSELIRNYDFISDARLIIWWYIFSKYDYELGRETYHDFLVLYLILLVNNQLFFLDKVKYVMRLTMREIRKKLFNPSHILFIPRQCKEKLKNVYSRNILTRTKVTEEVLSEASKQIKKIFVESIRKFASPIL